MTETERGQPEVQPTPVESPLDEPHTPEAERRQLTVMFCDLVESTKLSSQLDPEDLRDVVREYQKVCTDVIHRYDGHVAQLLGDGLLVYFGYPQAHEDDAQRAIHTGLGIVEAIGILNRRLDQTKGVKLAVRVSVHTGPVVVGEMGGEGRQEQLALGETPNLAARLQGLAEPDTVVISEATHRLVEGYFDCETLGERELRGVAEPVVVYQVRQESDARSRLDIASARGLTPLVGRESESTLLFERWEQATDGNGQVILLSGEAGIGKSRLVQALKEHVLADGSHVRLECRSSPYFTNSALYPIIDMVQRTLQFQTGDTPEQKLVKLEQNLSQSNLSMDETVPLFASLLSVPVPEDRFPPLNLTPQRQRQKTLEAIVVITLELSARQPVLFILEDLHWTDPTTLELLDLLIDQTPTASICALLTCRPEFQSQWSNRSYFTQVSLNRLSADDVEQMVERITGSKSIPPEVMQQIIERSDGVALYVEEMTKAVLESGSLKEVDGRYELIGSLTSLAIPATLQDSLMARLDRLVTAKGLAQQAAVIGRQFSYALLQAVSELDETTLQRELNRLVEAELVYQRGLLPQATYIFKHALVQDAAYHSLLRSTRQGYHRRIAEVLTERFPETTEHQPELLANHYSEAGLSEQALNYWYQAGQRSKARSAHVETISHLRNGLALLETLPPNSEHYQRELAMQVMLGSSLLATKGQGSADMERAYSRARELCQQVGDTPQLFDVLCGLHLFYILQTEYQTSLEIGQQLLALAQHQDVLVLRIGAHLALGMTWFFLVELSAARRELERGLSLYRSQQCTALVCRYGESDAGVVCLVYLAAVLEMQGYPDQSQQRHQEALTLAQELGHPYSLALALGWSARLYQYRHDVPAVREQAEAVIALATQQGFASWLPQGTYLRGWALALQGQGKEGIAQIYQGLDSKRATGSKRDEDRAHALLAEAYGQIECSDKGLAAISEGLAVVDQYGERTYEAELYRFKGQLLIQQSSDNAVDAESCFHQALDVARHQEAKSFELRAATSLARLWLQQGKRNEAHELLGDVYGWFTEGFDTADLIDAKALLDELA